MSTFRSHKINSNMGLNGADRSLVITELCCRASFVGGVAIFEITARDPSYGVLVRSISCGFLEFCQDKTLKLKSTGKEAEGMMQFSGLLLCLKLELPALFLADPRMPLKASWDGALVFPATATCRVHLS